MMSTLLFFLPSQLYRAGLWSSLAEGHAPKEEGRGIHLPKASMKLLEKSLMSSSRQRGLSEDASETGQKTTAVVEMPSS